MNPYVWELYLKSGGNKVVEFFEKSLTNPLSIEYAEEIKRLHSVYAASKTIVENTHAQLLKLVKEMRNSDILQVEYLAEEDVDEINAYITKSRWNEYFESSERSAEQAFEGFICNIACETTMLAIAQPDLYIPYYFQCNYNVFEIIASTFEIDLPTIPLKKNYKERFMFYGEICKALYKYKKENNWSPYELMAFLYDFAPKYIGGTKSYIISDLPDPKSAFFVGGSGKEDIGDIGAADRDDIERWQCNPDTRAGDLVVMYITSPISAITSIWRSCSVGFNDPFFFYYRCTYLSNPIKVKNLTLSQIKEDPVLSEMPIVRKNMQGINGVELRPSEYNRILDICRSDAMRMKYSSVSAKGNYSTEKEVEEKKIKEFLKNLGYTESDYVQQLYIPIGNHNTLLIPDFVLLPKNKGGYQSAFAVVEAKRSISSQKELTDAIGQARSYALQLDARYSIVASQEGIWITNERDRFTKVIQQYTWKELKNSDTFHALQKEIGKP